MRKGQLILLVEQSSERLFLIFNIRVQTLKVGLFIKETTVKR